MYITKKVVNPKDKWPGTTWRQITGYFLRAANDTATGGSDTTTLTLGQLPKWEATVAARPGASKDTKGVWAMSGHVSEAYAGAVGARVSTVAGSIEANRLTFSFGNNEAHNNMPKYQDVYVWERTA